MSEKSELTQEELVLAGLDNEYDNDLNGGNSQSASRWGVKPTLTPAKNVGRREMGASLFRKQALERVSKMSKNVQEKLLKGDAQISDMQYYSCAAITGKNCDLIDESINRTLGKTNLDGGKIDKDKEFVLSALKFSYDALAIDGAFADEIPFGVYNGEWELQLDGKKVIDYMPMNVFADGVVGYNVNKPYGYYALNNPKLIKSQTTIELEVRMPATVTGFLKVMLIGTSVKPN